MRIPFYQQVILLSFHCDRCGYSNNELQSGEPVQVKVCVLYVLKRFLLIFFSNIIIVNIFSKSLLK